MYNIKQITNFTIPDTAPTTQEQIKIEGDVIPGTSTPRIRTVYYKDITNDIISQGIEKIGYCCEPKALQYPIYLHFNNGAEYEYFQIGKTGMYEVQPEEYKNIEDPEQKEEIIKIQINGVKVPWQWEEEPNPSDYGYKFKFDYICNSDE